MLFHSLRHIKQIIKPRKFLSLKQRVNFLPPITFFYGFMYIHNVEHYLTVRLLLESFSSTNACL